MDPTPLWPPKALAKPAARLTMTSRTTPAIPVGVPAAVPGTMYIVGRHQSRTQCKLEQMMTNNQDVELQVLPDLEQQVVIDHPIPSAAPTPSS